MTCQEWREWMSADLDGEARDGEIEAVREHLSRCAGCRRSRAAAEALRMELSAAACESSEAAARDEAVLAGLRRDGLCVAPGHRRAPSGWVPALRRGLAGAALVFERLPMQPALAAMGLSFALTLGALRWAGSGPPAGLVVPSRSAGAVARATDPHLMEEWLSGSPTLASLARLERARPRKPAPSPIHRGAVGQRRRRVG